MAGWGNQSRYTKALRCPRIVGLSSIAGAFVGLGISPLNTANTNELDLISEPESAGKSPSSRVSTSMGCPKQTRVSLKAT
jgi:hypothetical protein